MISLSTLSSIKFQWSLFLGLLLMPNQPQAALLLEQPSSARVYQSSSPVTIASIEIQSSSNSEQLPESIVHSKPVVIKHIIHRIQSSSNMGHLGLPRQSLSSIKIL